MAPLRDIRQGGVLLVDKPAGVTSFDVVNRVRRRLVDVDPGLAPRRGRGRGPKPPRFKCGHAGTLDPLATGLLVVLVGRGSRLSPFLLGLDKTYRATVRFGTATLTLDREGEVTATAALPASAAALETALGGFRGDLMQVPPVVSALKRDGRALHARVRAGEEVEPPEARPVRIDRIEILATRGAAGIEEADLEVGCSSGTYVRSLARDLAAAADSVGHIAELRRLAVGPFSVDEALTDVMDRPGEDLAAALLPLAAALPHVPAIDLSDDEAERVRSGGQPGAAWRDRLPADIPDCGKAGPVFRMLGPDGMLVAVGRIDDTGAPRTAAVMSGKG
jgi:tRNA pseudouridine55 synthase